MKKKIACMGDPASHPGSIVTSGQADDGFLINGEIIAVAGAAFACQIEGHGTTLITPVVVRTKKNGKLVITEGAVAGCGAVIVPPERKCNVG